MGNEHLDTQLDSTKAIIVGVLLHGTNSRQIGDDLDELESLLATLEIPVQARVIQKRQKLSAGTLLGSGKVEEIKQQADQVGANLIVFDHALSPPQVRNLEKMTELQILDRTGVILEIFSKHARSTQAKTQVEIARLEYLLPRLTGAWTHFQRQAGGGVRSRGMGEKQIEIDRRRARERIAKLQKQLEQIRKERQIQRKARANELNVALVGYTNSGKTTLMKSLTRASLEGKDELFATLDTNIKTIDPRTKPKILLSDTVGFIRSLPHSLVESFKSTLDEVLEADLLLHVVDVSHPNYRDQIEITEKVLGEIGASNIPQFLIFNKFDRVDDPTLPRILKAAYPKCRVISANSTRDALELREHIYQFFRENFSTYSLKLPVGDQAIQSLIYKHCLVLKVSYEEHGFAEYFVQSAREVYERLTKYMQEHELSLPILLQQADMNKILSSDEATQEEKS